MSWTRMLRELWPFGSPAPSEAAANAVRAAEASLMRAHADKRLAAELRVEAELARAQVRAHNKANRFDRWLQEVIQGRG